jgi:menaquinol-cytochrome c reductase cytochrome b/c subunit
MADAEKQDQEIFPVDPSKTYGLMELARGTSPLVAKEPEDTLMTFPHLAIIEVLAALAVMVLLLFLSVVRDAPLEEFANPDIPPSPAKAAWYLMGIQELILHMHPTWGAIILPGLVALALAAIPYLDRSQQDVGHWFASPRGKRIAVFTALGTLLIVPVLVALDSLVGVRSVWPGAPPLVANIVIPLGTILVLLALLYFILHRIKASTREVMIAYFTVLVVSLVVLTLTMIFFRGPGMHLYWPWAMPAGH